MPDIAARRSEPRRFVPENFDASDPLAVGAIYDALDKRDVSTRQALEEAIYDADELAAVLMEEIHKAEVDVSIDSANPEYEAAFNKVIEEIMPVAAERSFRLKQHLLSSPALDELGDFYEVFLRDIRAEVGIFREVNVPLQVEDAKMSQEYEKIAGQETADFRGETLTVPQLEVFFAEPDSRTRRRSLDAARRNFPHRCPEA